MRRRCTALWAAAALFLPLLGMGCDTADSTTEWLFEEHRVGDTVSVTTLSGQVWSEGVRPVIDLSIGVLEGDEALMLPSITRMAEDPAGRIYVLDEQGPIIRHFEANGRFLSEVRFPDDVEPLLFAAGHIWGIRRGEFDEQYVVRMVLAGID